MTARWGRNYQHHFVVAGQTMAGLVVGGIGCVASRVADGGVSALDVSSGEVLVQCKRRRRHQEFLSFLKHIDQNVPDDLDVHLICDNHATHKHPKVRNWPAQWPRYHMLYTPTYALWLNQVERWFGLIAQQVIRFG